MANAAMRAEYVETKRNEAYLSREVVTASGEHRYLAVDHTWT